MKIALLNIFNVLATQCFRMFGKISICLGAFWCALMEFQDSTDATYQCPKKQKCSGPSGPSFVPVVSMYV